MLTVRLLGCFALALDNDLVALPSPPVQSLLAWLVLHPGVAHRRERLAGLFWPDANEENARNNLRHALWRLRRIVPEEFVETDSITIRWVAESDWRLDVAELTASPALATSADDLIPSLQVYGGELLPGFYEEWVGLERDRLAALYADRVARLLELLLAEQRWRETIDWAEKWIAQGNTPEPAYRALMSAHASLGNAAAALTAYQRCIEALDRELSVPPSAETTALADAIRNGRFPDKVVEKQGDRAIDTPPEHLVAQSPSQLALLTNLPAPTTPLIGREADLESLTPLLLDPSHRLVTILGPGGMGKSRLSLAAGHAVLPHFPDGVFLVELAALSNAEDIPQAIGSALGFPFQNDARPPRQQLLDFLRGHKHLLILDNFEHLLDGAEFLVEMLETAPGLHLLVTTRERLHIHAETLYRLNGLTFSFNGAGGDAVELFVQSAQRTLRGYLPGPDQWPAIARICRLVDGMPLGILLAAYWVEHLSPAEIADEIAANVAFLRLDLRDLDPRHRAIEAVFEQSWQRLSPAEQQGLMGLAIFAGGFDRQSAQSVAGVSIVVLSRLVDKAMVWRVREGRYDLHELIRQLARQKLRDAGQEATIQGQHGYWFLDLVSRQADALKGTEEAAALHILELERENIRAAWLWAANHREIDRMLAAVEALGIFYNRPGRWEEGRALMEATIHALGEAVDPAARLLLAWLGAWHGVFLHRTDQVALARQRLTDVLKRWEDDSLPAESVPRLQAFALLHRGGDLMTNRRRAETGDDLRRALALYQEIDDDWWTIHALNELARWETFDGQLRKAWEKYEEALELARNLNYPGGQIYTLSHMSFIAEHMGHLDKAEQAIRDGLSIDPGNHESLSRLSFALLSTGKFDESVAISTKRLEWAEKVGAPVAFQYNTLARGYLHLGRFAEGYTIAEKAVKIWQDAHGWPQPFMRRTQGRAALALGQIVEARQILQQSLASQQGMGNANRFALGGAFIDCAYPALELHNRDEARTMLVAGLRLVQSSEAFYFCCQSLPCAALLLASLGRLEEAAYLSGALQRYPGLTQSHWYATVALDRLEQLLAPLSPDVRDAAEARGRAQELPELTAELLAMLDA